MADSRTITINLKAVSDFNDVVSNAKQIQTVLNKLKLPESLKGNFEKIFGDIEKYGNKAAESVAKGFKTKGDLSGFEKSVNSVSHAWEQLLKNLNRIDDNILKDSFNIDTSKLKEAEKEIEKYKQLISTEAGSKGLSNIESTLSGLVKQYGKVTGSAQEFINALKSGEIEKATKEYEKFSAAAEKIKDNNRRDAYEGLAKSMQEILRNLDIDKVKGWTDELAKAKINLENLDAIELQKLIDAFARSKDVIHEAAQEEKTFGENSITAAQGMQNVNSELDHFKQRITYFFGAANAVNLFKRALRSVFETVKDLDKVMTETAVVTKFDVSDMWKQLPDYTKRANELGVTIHSAYEAATLYYQQGLNTNQVMEVSNQTLKMARIAGLDAAEATDRMTNALRGFNMEINETSAEKVADVYSKLAAMSASNVDEISTAMTKVASLASNANMEFETTAAFLAQIIETTRESAETAGTALKTVIARFSEVKKLYSEGELLGTDEEGEAIDVNKVSKALRTAGVDLNEYLTGAKGLDDIFVELASKWDNLDQVQQRYIATMAAGSRQQSRFIALMQDYGRTQELVSAAQNANGASQEQYEKTLESMETKLNRLKNAWNEFTMGVANNKLIKGAVDLLTGFIQAVNKLTGSLPGALNSIAKLGLAFGAFKIGKNVFNKGLAQAGQVLRTGINKTTDDVSKNVVKSGEKIGTGIKDGITKELQNLKGAKNPFLGLSKNFASEFSQSIGTDISNAINNMTIKIPKSETLNDVFNNINNAFQSGGFEAAQQAAEQYGITLDELKLKLEELTNKGIKNIGTSMIATGSSIMMLTSLLSRLGVMGDKATKIFSSMGMTIMAAGILMKLFGDSAMAAGIKTFIAGKLGETGWMWITWVFTAIAALVGLVIGLVSNAETAEKRMKRLEDEAKKAAEAATNVADKYKELGEALTELGEQETALKKMTEGTAEWAAAVMNLNQKVLDLIEKFPELAEYITSDNGILGFDEEGIAKVEELYNKLVYQTQAASAAANLAVHQQGQEDAKYTATSMVVGRVAAYGLLPEERELAEKVSRALAGNQESIEELNGKLQGTTIDQIIKDNKGIDRVNAVFDALGQQMYLAGGDEQYEEFVNAGKNFNLGELSDPGYYKSIMAPVLTEMAGEIEKDQIEIFSGILDADKINEIIETNAKDIKIDKAYKDFFKQLYGDDITFKRDGTIEQNGEEFLSAESAKRQYVAGHLDEYAINAAQEIYDKINGFNDEGVKQALIEFYKNGQESLSKSNADYLQNFFRNNKADAAGILYSIPQLEAIVTKSIESYKSILEDFNTGIGKPATIDRRTTGITGQAESVKFGQDVMQNVSTQALESYFNNLSAIYGQYGEEAASKFSDSFHGILGKATKEQQAEIIELAKKYDFTKYADVQDFSKDLKELGYNIPDSEINALTNEFTNLAGITREFNLSALSNQFKDILSLSKDIGDREELEGLTPEEYEKLIDILPDLADSFAFDGENFLYLDGTMADLAYAIRENTAAILGKTAGQLQEQIDLGNAVAEAIDKADLNKKYNKVNTEDLKAGIVSSMEAIRPFMEDLYGKNYADRFDDAHLLADYQEKMEAYNNRAQNQADLDQYNAKFAASTAYQRLMNTNAQDMTSGNYTVFGDEQAKGLMTPQALEEYDKLLEKTVNSTSNLKARSEELAAGFKDLDMSSEDATRTGRELAIQYDKLERGIDDVRKAVGDELEVLNDSTSTAAELGDSYQNIAKVASKVFGKGVTADFVEEYKEQFKELEQGVPGAFEAICDGLNKKNAETWAQIYDSTYEGSEAVRQIIAALDGISFDAYGYADFSEVEKAAQVAGMEVLDFIKILEQASGITLSYDPGWMANLANAYAQLAAAQESGDPRGLSAATQNLALVKGNVGKFTVTRGGSGYNPSGHGGYTPKGGSGGGGGGGGGKEEKPTYWKNPYDELYNLTEKINEALRTREALERRYQKIAKLSVTTAGEMRKAFKDQISQLQYELALQKQLQEGRLKQLRNVGNEYYIDKDGNRKTFAQLGVTKYARYDEKAGTIILDNAGLDAIERDPNRSEEGEAAEAYISLLEERSEAYEDIRDAIWDIEDEIEDLAQQAIDDYLNFEDRVIDAIVDERQKEIDAFGELSDAIEDATNKVLDGMQKQIEAQRQMRENEKTEEELADKEARLAYLSRDTSGANQMEIMQLQEELDDARQNYTDSLIDQAIQQMRDDADLAAEQRAEQQAVMEAQLEVEKENGEIAQHAADLILAIAAESGALGEDSELMKLLKNAEGFEGMSIFRQKEWLSDTFEEFNKAQSIQEAQEEKERQKQASAANVAATTPTVTGTNTNSVTSTPAPQSSTPQTTWDTIVAAYNKINQGAWGNGVEHRVQMGRQEGFSEQSVRKAQQLINYTYPTYLGGYGYSWDYAKRLLGYKTGGLADFTGPAWLDGTRSHPEMVLNAADTENLIALKDILSNMWGGRGSNASNLGGDNYYTFDIQAEIGDDYDVDQLAERLKYLIVQDSNYRNVNAINFMR